MIFIVVAVDIVVIIELNVDRVAFTARPGVAFCTLFQKTEDVKFYLDVGLVPPQANATAKSSIVRLLAAVVIHDSVAIAHTGRAEDVPFNRDVIVYRSPDTDAAQVNLAGARVLPTRWINRICAVKPVVLNYVVVRASIQLDKPATVRRQFSVPYEILNRGSSTATSSLLKP